MAEKFSNVRLDEHIVMPNHFHGIIEITNRNLPVRADPRVCPALSHALSILSVENKTQYLPHSDVYSNTNAKNTDDPVAGVNNITWGEHTGSPLHEMVQWFKTMTTNEYIRGVKLGQFMPFEKRFWQRNYYEHIVRNEKALYRIREYIKNNPGNWKEDILSGK